MLNVLADHLWQSTLFGAAAALVAVLLRNGPARVRYIVWLAASCKFLVPCAALIALGARVGGQADRSISPAVVALVEAVGQPFSSDSTELFADVPVVATSLEVVTAGRGLWPFALGALWLFGVAVIGVRWWWSWQALRRTVRESAVAIDGREATLFARIVADAGAPPVALRLTHARLEPGVFGIWAPVLLWPRSISARLDDAQITAILTHELAHVRRRDNLSAMAHMLVRAVFWFHPLVAWIDARLMHEREHACDEEVVRSGSEPQAYAEGLLKTCEFYVESSLACVSGVTGADLKRRVATIMRADALPPIARWQRGVLALLIQAALIGPLALGMMAAPRRHEVVMAVTADRAVEQPDAFPDARFAQASITKSADNGARTVQLLFQPDGRFTATNVTLRMLISAAYGRRTPLQAFQLTGGPQWLSAERFSVTARADVERPAAGGPPPVMFAMLRNLLAERFGVRIRREVRETDIYALVLSRRDGQLGPALTRSTVDCAALAAKVSVPVPMPKGQVPPCAARIGPGVLAARALTLAEIARRDFPRMTGRMVIDRTGLEGPYDLNLKWTPETMTLDGRGIPEQPAASDALDSPAERATRGSATAASVAFATALEEQLGLSLEPARGTVDYFVIERVERPTPD